MRSRSTLCWLSGSSCRTSASRSRDGRGVDPRHDGVVVAVQPRRLEDAEPASRAILGAALALVLQEQRVRDREDPGTARRDAQPAKAADRLERAGERLGRQIEGDVRVAAVAEQRAVDGARVPAVEGAERVRVDARTPQQFAVVEVWGVHASTRMHNGAGV